MTSRVKAWFQDKGAQVISWVREGAHPGLLAKSAAVGFVLGLSPILGISTLLALGVLAIMKLLGRPLHTPMCLLANLASIPVEVLCILPFMRLGELLLGAPRLDVAPVSLKEIIFDNPGQALAGVGHAVLGWLVATPFLTAGLWLALRPLFAWIARRSRGGHDRDEMEQRLVGRRRSDNPWDAGVADEEEAELGALQTTSLSRPYARPLE